MRKGLEGGFGGGGSEMCWVEEREWRKKERERRLRRYLVRALR